MHFNDDILTAVHTSEDGQLIRPLQLKTDKQNQLLFFMKPECFLAPIDSQPHLLELISSILEQFGVEVAGSVTVKGDQLGQLAIMDRHYGYINGMSRKASELLSDDDKSKFLHLLEASTPNKVLGGHEVLTAYTQFSPSSLDELWSTKRSARVRGGLYGQIFEIDDDNVLVINGFHPAQLSHFTESDRTIAILVLNSDLPWSILRKSMIGDTFPDKAEIGSIRRTLHDQASDLKLEDVSISNNYCHLSAGPFEGLFELQNFLAKLPNTEFQLSDCRMSEHLVAIGYDDIQGLLENPGLQRHPQHLSLFEASEDCDALSAAHLAQSFL